MSRLFSARLKAPKSGVSIATSIVVLFVLLAVTVGLTVLFVAGGAAHRMIEVETRKKAVVINRTITQRAIAQLTPVEALVSLLGNVFADVNISEMPEGEISRILYSSLAAAPQASSVALVDNDLSLKRAFRNRPDQRFHASNWSDDEDFTDLIAATKIDAVARWSEPFYAEAAETTLLSRLMPFTDQSGETYVIIATVDLTSLSTFVAELAPEIEGSPFIFYGKDALLAHPALASGIEGLSDQTPLPPIDGFSDARLEQLWRASWRTETSASDGVFASMMTIDRTDFYVAYQPIFSFGDTPWYVGGVFDMKGFAPRLVRTPEIFVGAAALLIISAIAAVLIGRAISWPIRSLSAAATQISRWEIDHDLPLQKSTFREINEASEAFSSALRALRSLRLYLPKTLPRRLISTDDPRNLKSESHQITVLFTDIEGFTSLSEAMRPEEVAALLNAHFGLISSCISAEAGVVDKFIGDAVMAFWGGLQLDDAHAEHACRAALAIRRAVEADNIERIRRGEAPIRLRIGIHTGEAIVGNIGAAGRANFTVIGDTVNTAQRLEGLARTFREGSEDVAILISDHTARLIDDSFTTVSCGKQVLRGRRQPEEVHLLTGVARDPGESGRMTALLPEPSVPPTVST